MDILTTLLPTLGSAGVGSMLKIVSGFFDSRAAAQLEKIRLKRADVLQNRGVDLEYQKALFGNSASGASGLMTRRIVALLFSITFVWLMVWCAVYPSLPLTTLVIPESKEAGSLLWGLYSWSPHKEQSVVVTSGHLLIIGMNQIGLMTGFYFTPGGRK